MFSQPATIDTLFEPHMAIFKTIVMLRMRFFFCPSLRTIFLFFHVCGPSEKKEPRILKRTKHYTISHN